MFPFDTRTALQSPMENNYIFSIVPNGVENNKRKRWRRKYKWNCLIHFKISVSKANTLCIVKHTQLFLLKNQELYSAADTLLNETLGSRTRLYHSMKCYFHSEGKKHVENKPCQQKSRLTMHDTSHAATDQWTGILLWPWDVRKKILIPNVIWMNNYIMLNQELSNGYLN